MNSNNENFALYFKTREKAILERGENSNYINDYPKDLYLYDYEKKISYPLISYAVSYTHLTLPTILLV